MSYFARSGQLPTWIGELPEGWGSDWLKWHVSHSAQRPDEAQQTSLPYLSNEDIASWTGKLLREDLEPTEADSRLFRSGDVLFNKLRPYLAKVFHANFDGVSSGELLCLRPSGQVSARYLFYVLTSFGFIDAIDSYTFGSKTPRADWETVGHQPLPLPRLEVQQRITRLLDEKTARIDALIEKKQALLELLAEKRQALITHAVTKGLNPDVPMKPSGFDWIGEAPDYWVCCGLGQKIKLQRGVDITKDQRIDGQFPVVSSGGVEYFHDTKLCDGPGVLVGRKGSAGKLHYVAEDYWPHDTTLYVREFRGNYRRFVWYLFHTLDLASFDSGSSNPTVNRNRVHPMRTVWPPFEEQQEIARHLDDEQLSFDKQAGLIRSSVQALEELRAALITAAVTGQLPELNG